MSGEEFVACLADLESLRTISKDWFTLHQLGGSKVGRGITNLAQTLKAPDRLFEEVSFSLHNRGYGVYIANLTGSLDYLVIRFELPKHRDEITNVSLTFMLDGHPVSGQKYLEIVEAFGFTDLLNAKPTTLPSAEIRFQDPIETTSVEQIYKGQGGQEPWVRGLMVANPFQAMPELAEQLSWNDEENPIHLKDAKASLEALQEYNKLYGELQQHHPGTAELEYRIKSISATYLTPLFNQQNIWSLSLEISW
jgi:hypothetical protein